ncbi:MAG: sulfurtransferase TusA family protein [Candidatus Heimdallarchaeota archaeon]
MQYTIKQEIDARGFHCPGPLMELVRMIKEIEVGDIVALLSEDEGSINDIPKWIEKAGHELVEVNELDTHRQFVVKKGEKIRRRRREK